jgi:polyketide cyclase/dehydrase/lipid transport protein
MVKHSRSARIRHPQPGISPAGVFRGERPPQMKFLRFALFAVFGLFATVIGIAYFKSSSWSAEGALIVEAAPEKILPLVATPKHWLDWDPWSDPTEEGFEASFEGPDAGAGAKMSWSSSRNRGRLTILEASVAGGIRYELDLDDMPGKGLIRLEPYGVQTRVRWTYSGDLGGNLGARFVLGWIERALQATMQKGLANLRTKALAGG